MSYLNLSVHKQNKLQCLVLQVRAKEAWSQTCIYLNWPKFFVSYLFFIEGIIKSKSVILYILCYPIYFKFRLMYFYLGISTRDRVYLSILLLFFKDGSLPHTDSKLKHSTSTLRSALETWGDNIFYLNLFFSIIS